MFPFPFSPSNTSTFRNRYDRAGYRGTADLGPVRFNATRSQMSSNLPMTNTFRPQSSLAATRQQQQTQPFRPQSAQSQYYAPQQATQSQQRDEQRFQAGGYEEAPRGVYSAPVQSVSRPSTSSQYAAPVTVNDRPYYVAPFDAPPNHQFAPEARALGNKTYAFETDSPNYAFSSSFRGQPQVSSRPLQDPGQSIPYGRLQAENAADVRLKMSMDSWGQTFNVPKNRTDDPNINYNLDGIRKKMTPEQQAANFCKTSISSRLETGSQMRYHVPNYCGFVPTVQFRHGATYGKTTRLAIVGSQAGL